MKNPISFIFLFLLFIFSKLSSPQVLYNHKIDSVLNLVSLQSISKMNREMSADTMVKIGGIPQLLYSRYAPTIGNVRAAQYVYEKLQSFGLNAKYMISSSTNCNVYAEKIGIKYPNKKFLIGGHYDDIKYPLPEVNDTIFGADDNASGVCGMLEAARLLANMNLDYTVIFIAFDEEEVIYRNGSNAFADSLILRSDTLLGVLNLDMIAWDGNNDSKADIWTNSNSENICNLLIGCNNVYQTGLFLTKRFDGYGSDHQSFWQRGFKAISLAELESDFNPNWHLITDKFNRLNLQYFLKMTKLSVATMLTWTMGNYFYIIHNPIPSGMDTSEKVAVTTLLYSDNVAIGSGTNAPRLYYKFGNGQNNYVNPFENNGDVFKFRVPGRPAGSKVMYYIAVQDSAGSSCVTLPYGGSGVNPPGTTPPPTQYIYYIWTSTNNFCSNKIKPINDFDWTEDTIHVSGQGIVRDVDVTLNLNHSNDGDLLIKLYNINSGTILSQFNGTGGQNFTNTIFDDSATIPITQGTPPFTGRYKPQGSLISAFNGQQMAGDWILKIYDINGGNTGNLLNWCIQFWYENPIGVINTSSNIPNGYKLFQNYPNPFNPSTIIRFQIKDLRFVSLKVYDIQGKEVATLVNEKQKPGSYEVTFDGSNLPSGVYFYQLKIVDPLGRIDNFIETKKLILLK